MKEKDREVFRDLLLELRRRFVQNVSQMQQEIRDGAGAAQGERSDMPLEHLADRGSDNYARDLMLGMIQDSEAEIIDIDRALEKLDEGTYGVCEGCGEDIPAARMKAIPFASLCLDCKQIEEQQSLA